MFFMQPLELDTDWHLPDPTVANTKPCPFLGSDNFCSIYDKRPSDCERFPYTDEDVFFKRPAITLKNVTFCPAVFHVFERLIEKK